MTRVLEGARYSFEPAKGELEEPTFLKAAKREKKHSAALTVLIVCIYEVKVRVLDLIKFKVVLD
jgi:hypothetical protein